MLSVKKLTFLILLLLSINRLVNAQSFQSCQSLLQQGAPVLNGKHFFAFPAPRENPLPWFDSIPSKTAESIGRQELFEIDAQPGEFFVYQVGVWALRENIEKVSVSFSPLTGRNGGKIATARMTCFNEGGTDFKGRPFSKQVSIPAGRVQALWMGVDLQDAPAGQYEGQVTISAGSEKQTIPLRLTIAGARIANHGYDEGRRLARLNWLNATVGINKDIVKGFKPVAIQGNIISILGRSVRLDATGLPAGIETYFTSSNRQLSAKGQPLLAGSFRFIIEKADGTKIKLSPQAIRFIARSAEKAEWSVLNTSPEADITCTGSMEFDGFLDYKLSLTAKKALQIKDIRLEVPVKSSKAVYMMGLNHEGGFRTADWRWKWDTGKNQDALWIGDINGGLRLKWKAENYKRPLVNIYYRFGPLQMPPSWDNGGNGGVDISGKENEVLVNAYSGKRMLRAGERLNYDFELLLTPFKLIDPAIKFGDRYYQGGGRNSAVKIADAKKAGANIINIHQADDIYPFINYPYLDENREEMTGLAARAHAAGLRMKFYYTTRELTKNLPEFRAFYSLNGEVIFPGPGNAARTKELHPDGPARWLVENLREKYIPAWYDTIRLGKFKGEVDLSVITTPDSRLNNFYVAGLDWMEKNIKMDGVYIDDCALDRYTLLRARKIIDHYRPDGRMDLHSWNHFNASAGYASCLNLYMDLLPSFDHVWIGEGRNYDRSADHWLIEVSGIPFGVTGQMLEGGGNPWRGMVYGITNRAGWTPNPPTAIWQFWDKYNIQDKILSGYWDKDCPLTTDNPMIKSSLYRGKDLSIIALANWSDTAERTTLTIDWEKTGLRPGNCEIFMPAIHEFQDYSAGVSLKDLTVPGKKGWLIIIKRK